MTTPLPHHRGTLRPMLRLVAPVLVEQVLHILVFYVDMYLAGRYLPGDAPLAAINLAGYAMWLVFTLFSVVAIGAMVQVARAVGAGDFRLASHMTNQGILCGGALVVAVGAIGLILLDPFISLLRLEGAAHRQAVVYLRIVLPTLPAIMLLEVGIACLRGAGDMVSGLVLMAIVNTVNVLVSSSLLLGLAGLPVCGWRGLAYGTAAAQVVGGVALAALLRRGRAGLRLRLDMLRPYPERIRRLLRVGIPGGADSLIVVACHLWFLSIINSLGTVAAAAHGIGVRIEALAFMPGAAFNMAAATMAGQLLGARDDRRAARSILFACLIGGGLMLAAAALFYARAVPLSEFFQGGRSTEVTRLAARLVRIVACVMPALAIVMIVGGGLRGAGDTRWPLLFTLIGFLAVRIPLAALLALDAVPILGLRWTIPGYGLGAVGAWYAMAADVAVRAVLLIGRFLQGGWKRTVV